MTTWGELAICATWLDSKLRGDSTINTYVNGNIWLDDAPEKTLAPYIVLINKSPGKDLMVIGQDRVWTDFTYDVQLVVPGNDIIAGDPSYVRIGQLLHKGSGTTPGGNVISCTRIRTDGGNSIAAGVEYRHMVQTFEMLVQQS